MRVFIRPFPGMASNTHFDSKISMRTASDVTGTEALSAERHVAVTENSLWEMRLSQCISNSRDFSGHGSLYVWCTSCPCSTELSRVCEDTAP